MKNVIFGMRILKGAVLAALLFAASRAPAQIITNAYDVATNYAAAGNFFAGDNHGLGFGAWTITAGGGGQYLATHDTVQYGTYDFVITNMTANGVTTANRPFSAPLANGASFSVRLRLNHLDTSSNTNGFELQDASGNVLFSFWHRGGDNANGWYTDAGVTGGTATNFPYNFQGFTSLTFTLDSASTYTFKDNNNGASFSGTLSGAAVTQVTFFRANGANTASDGQDFEFNALMITALGSKPVFDVQPKNAAAVAGGTVSLSAHATSNLGQPDYQWYFTNGPISGAINTNLVLTNVSQTNAGNYYVVASNTAGATTSTLAAVTIIPFGYTNAYDVAANYSGFSGNQGFGFGSWTLNTSGGGSYISGDTPPLFGIWNSTVNASSTAVRPFATTLPVGGSFLVQLQMNNLDFAINTNAIELQDASGNVLFSYWHVGGDAEQGDGHYTDAGVVNGTATNFWYHFGQVDTFAFTLTSASTYKFTDLASGASFTGTLSGAPIAQVTFLRSNGDTTNSLSNGQDFRFNGLTMLSPAGNAPVFSRQPVYGGGLVGSAINLSGTASGAGTVTYQWYFGNTLIAGATNSTLTLANAALTNSGNYFLVAANTFGSTTSTVSVVTVYVENNRLLAYEGFNYTGGSSPIDNVSQDGGLGWSGAWTNVSGTGNTIGDGSLVGATNAPAPGYTNVPPGYDALSTGNLLWIQSDGRTGRWLDCSTNGTFAARGYLDANGDIGAAGKTVYVSFLMQPYVTSHYYEFEFHRGDLSDPGRIAGVGNDSSTNDVYLRTPGDVFADLGLGDSYGDTIGNIAVDFYVVRIDYGQTNDEVRVYRNPTSLTEPPNPTVTVTNAGDVSFNGISVGTYWGNLVWVDEIRIGGTWADALGMPGSNSMMLPIKQGANWTVRFAGNPSFTYRVQRATSVAGPWTDLGTATPAESGMGTLTDSNPPSGQAFYRVVTP